MARKKPVAAPPAPSPEKVAQALQTGDFAAALVAARDLHRSAATPENTSLFKRALSAAAQDFADRDKAIDFNRILSEADEVDPDDPIWKVERACLLARGGRLADALMRVDEAAHSRVLGHAADRAIRTRSKEFIPDEMHAGFDAVLAAFRHHEAGNEKEARESLEWIGLRSPFLEWKVLLRGLLALAAGDKTRAVENLIRLETTRLPARLAAPVRAALDPEYKNSFPAAAAARLDQQSATLFSNSLVNHLREMARGLGRDRPLAPAFRSAESALLHLRKIAPDLILRLASCLYHAILQQGQPQDLARYRKLFGNPPDDPGFHKLQARIAEQIEDLAMAHREWQQYETWLAGNPPGWAPVVAAQARAIILTRMGDNAAEAAERGEGGEAEELFGVFAPPGRKKPKPLSPPPEVCFARAVELAPGWSEANQRLYNALLDAGKKSEAEEVLRKYLALKPDDLGAVTSIADLLSQQGRAEEAAVYWLRALAIHPLDKPIRSRAAGAVLASARRKLADGGPTGAAAELDPHATLLDERFPASTAALRSVILTKEGKLGEAASLREQALGRPNARLAAAYHLAVDAQLAKLKPVDKRSADKALADELTVTPRPAELSLLIGAYDSYHIAGISYRGQKAHEKKVLDLVARCVEADAPELDFEHLATLLLAKREWKHARIVAEVCIQRFRSNPYFLLVRSEAGLEMGEADHKVAARLRKAEKLAENSSEPRHRELLDKINELLKEISPQFNFLDAFFNREPW